MDEAHRTSGVDRKVSGLDNNRMFQSIHRAAEIKAAKRLYMTATPRIYKLSSRQRLRDKGIETIDMSDLNVYGPEFHRLTFSKAVNEGILSDYRVIVLGIREGMTTPKMTQTLISLGEEESKKNRKPLIVNNKDITRLLGTSLAINGMTEGKRSERPIRLHRTIAFANTIARSKFFSKGIKHPQVLNITTRRIRKGDKTLNRAMKVESQHLDASHSALARNEALRNLENAGRNNVAHILCNVKLFSEGVDVPSLDAIVFMEPRDSQIDIVQAVGRVMRRSEGKRFGYIVLPIPIEPGQNIIETLESGSDGYTTVGRVLRALQSHDERLVENPLNFIEVKETSEHDPKGENSDGLVQQELVLKLSDVADNVYAHVVASSGLGKPGLQTSNDIAEAVRSAARVFVEGQLENEFADAIGLTAKYNAKSVCTIAALLLINACLLHRRLSDKTSSWKVNEGRAMWASMRP